MSLMEENEYKNDYEHGYVKGVSWVISTAERYLRAYEFEAGDEDIVTGRELINYIKHKIDDLNRR